MNILAVSDEESNILWSERIKETANNIDLVISCGDLRKDYLEFLVTMINAPLLYVLGNHDEDKPEGGICIDGRLYEYNGVRFLGLGGSMRYRQDKNNMYTEGEMTRRFWKILPAVWLKGGFDILVTHAPAMGYGDLDDLAHKGFKIFNKIIMKYKPKYMLHGHIHASYGRIQKEFSHEAGTKIINACGYRIFTAAMMD
mgnify:CR=1 FL=1